MTEIEQGIREIVIEQDYELRQKVIHDMIQVWDKEEVGGLFSQYLTQNFTYYWLRRVLQN